MIMRLRMLFSFFVLVLSTLSLPPLVAQVASPGAGDPVQVEVLEATPAAAPVTATEVTPETVVVEAADDTLPDEPVDADPAGFWAALWAWLQANWIAALLGLLTAGEFIARLTPTEQDNKWFAWLRDWVDRLFPSRAKGGGKF